MKYFELQDPIQDQTTSQNLHELFTAIPIEPQNIKKQKYRQ